MSRPRRPRWLLDAERVDHAVYEAVADTTTPALDGPLSRLSRAANYSRLSLAAAAVLAATQGRQGRRAASLGLASVAVTAAVVNLAIKPLSRRGRPDPIAGDVPEARQVRPPGSRSFPSGHSAAAFAFATGVGRVLPREAVGLRLLAALVAYSRVHTGVHYPADVVAGSLIGSALAQITTNALEPRLDAAPLGLLVRKVSIDKVLPEIKIPGKVIQTSLNNETEQHLTDALAAAGRS